ncbi:MAG: glycosyltransferase [Planctomycetes bacterium]|nr:glycosyltransferase [Planctomycetota bacterium]
MTQAGTISSPNRLDLDSAPATDVLGAAAHSRGEADLAAALTRPTGPAGIEVSVVMPCLNEAETLETCIRKATQCLERNGVRGEVIVADNGSTDGSIEIARRAGARVVHVAEKGYGMALMKGFEAAHGKYLIMGDADDSYDFENLMPFIERMRAGDDVVMGNRFRGGIQPGAMPWHHRYIGNPVLTGVLNLFFRSGIGDAHCGLRGLTRRAFQTMRLRTSGMEFASEMVVKAVMCGLRMSEVSTTLKPDGRSRPPHLRSFRDGWRHLRFMMLLAPDWLLMFPGLVMATLGATLFAVLWQRPVSIGRATLDIHSIMLGALLVTVGYQGLTMGFAARIYAVQHGIGRASRALQFGFRLLNLERGLLAGGGVLAAGVVLIGLVVGLWAAGSFGPLDTGYTLRPLTAGMTLVTLGVQTILMSFFYSMLGLCGRQS